MALSVRSEVYLFLTFKESLKSLLDSYSIRVTKDAIMSDTEKISMLAETLDENAESLTLDRKLASLKRWDSMARLSLIILFDSSLGKVLTADQIKSFQTIGDIVKAMD